ncbi:hypothetical protein COCNU_13G004740 [Cocos nucifera]|uniref:Uncharacterized protein n=1 Tax=Cocos nucifera TaxID=13894 RepID=A0A8K0IUK7_COCNU|nr:hypothetical protein COCNU_13G004740 [Cocos nucifera]
MVEMEDVGVEMEVARKIDEVRKKEEKKDEEKEVKKKERVQGKGEEDKEEVNEKEEVEKKTLEEEKEEVKENEVDKEVEEKEGEKDAEFLSKNWSKHPNVYHKYLISLTISMCIKSKTPHHKLAGTVGQMIFDEVADDDKKGFRFLSIIINSENLH